MSIVININIENIIDENTPKPSINNNLTLNKKSNNDIQGLNKANSSCLNLANIGAISTQEMDEQFTREEQIRMGFLR